MGIDGWVGGWVAVVLADGAFEVALVGTDVGELVSRVPDAAAVAVDMPVGLADEGLRQADLLGREMLGRRRSTLFVTPTRAAVECEDYPRALAVNRERGAGGFSRQAWALRTKILQLDAFLRSGDAGRPVVEAHPELSFAALAGRVLASGKKTWAGQAERRGLLAGAGIVLPDDLGPAGAAGPDDVLDAAVVAWTAGRLAAGTARSAPAEPQRFSDGLAAAITS